MYNQSTYILDSKLDHYLSNKYQKEEASSEGKPDSDIPPSDTTRQSSLFRTKHVFYHYYASLIYGHILPNALVEKTSNSLLHMGNAFDSLSDDNH